MARHCTASAAAPQVPALFPLVEQASAPFPLVEQASAPFPLVD